MDCWALAEKAAARTTHLAKIVRCEPTPLGFLDASGLGSGGVWINPSWSGLSLVWRHPWPPYIIAKLVFAANLDSHITNSNLDIPVLVLYEATLLAAVLEAHMAAPLSGSDNTPTVLWSTREASTINLVVTELFRIHALHPRKKT